MIARFDLHVHSALSACAENVMSPRQVLVRAQAAGVNLLAITDHNASGHVALAQRLAPEYGLSVVPGMEVTSKEDVHVLALFRDEAACRDFQELIDGALPRAQNVPEVFGYQLLYDAADEIVDTDDRLRQVGTDLGLDRLVMEIHGRGGFAVPAHVTRNRYSLTSQLGFVNPDGGYDAVEIARNAWRREGHRLGERLAGYPVMTGSDAHFLEDVGRVALEVPGTAADVALVMQALAACRV